MNLQHYISHGLFLSDTIVEKFDYIIFEQEDDSSIINQRKKQSKKIVTLTQRRSIHKQDANTEHKILIVAKKIPIITLIDSFDAYKQVCIMGPAGCANKAFTMQESDNIISQIHEKNRNIYEAYSQQSLNIMINKKGKTYIPFYNKEYGETDIVIDEKTRLYSGKKAGAYGDDATILCSAAYMAEMSNCLNNLQHIDEILVDIFFIIKYNFVFTDDFLESIQRTKKVIIVLDQKNNDKYLKYILEELILRGVKISSIHIVTPEHKEITSIIPEFIVQEVQFDGISLYERIQSKFPQEENADSTKNE